jgi:hypothetical protein
MTRLYNPITRESLEVVREECLASFQELALERGHTLSDLEAEACFSTLVEVLQFHHLDFLEYACVAIGDGKLLDWSPLYRALATSYERYLWKRAFGPGLVEWEPIPWSSNQHPSS